MRNEIHDKYCMKCGATISRRRASRSGLCKACQPGMKRRGQSDWYWWRCRKCGTMTRRKNSTEPKRCDACRDKEAKEYRGHGERP